MTTWHCALWHDIELLPNHPDQQVCVKDVGIRNDPISRILSICRFIIRADVVDGIRWASHKDTIKRGGF